MKDSRKWIILLKTNDSCKINIQCCKKILSGVRITLKGKKIQIQKIFIQKQRVTNTNQSRLRNESTKNIKVICTK